MSPGTRPDSGSRGQGRAPNFTRFGERPRAVATNAAPRRNRILKYVQVDTSITVSTHHIGRSRAVKATLCFLFVSIAATLFNTGHAVDGFILKHVAVGYETATIGEIPDNNLAGQIPGFYAFLSSILLVTALDPLTVVHFPIQLVPYATVFFALCYLLSRGNVGIAGLLTGLQLFISSSATWRVHLWPHGVGTILFLTLLVSLVVLFRTRNPIRLLAVMLPCSLALVYTSYNLTAMYLLVLAGVLAFAGLLYVFRQSLGWRLHLDRQVWNRGTMGTVTVLAALTGTTVLVSEFFTATFLPLLRSGIDTDSIAQFFAVWLGGGSAETTPIAHLLVSQPDSVRYLAIARYAVVFTGIAALGTYVLYKLRGRQNVGAGDVLLVAYVSGLVVYFFTRALAVGSVPMSTFYVPGVLALAYLFYHVENRSVTVGVAVLLVLLSGTIVGTQIEHNRHGQIDRNVDAIYHAENEQQWVERYASSDERFLADETTRNLLVYNDVRDQRVPSYAATSSDYGVIDPAQAAALTTRQDPAGSECFVLNNRLKSMSLQNWQIITSWDAYGERIHEDPYVNKVYSEGGLWSVCD